jgi:hypothetical protein
MSEIFLGDAGRVEINGPDLRTVTNSKNELGLQIDRIEAMLIELVEKHRP